MPMRRPHQERRGMEHVHFRRQALYAIGPRFVISPFSHLTFRQLRMPIVRDATCQTDSLGSAQRKSKRKGRTKTMTRNVMRWTRTLAIALTGISMASVAAAAAELTVWCWDPNFNIPAMADAGARYTAAHPDTTFNINN